MKIKNDDYQKIIRAACHDVNSRMNALQWNLEYFKTHKDREVKAISNEIMKDSNNIVLIFNSLHSLMQINSNDSDMTNQVKLKPFISNLQLELTTKLKVNSKIESLTIKVNENTFSKAITFLLLFLEKCQPIKTMYLLHDKNPSTIFLIDLSQYKENIFKRLKYLHQYSSAISEIEDFRFTELPFITAISLLGNNNIELTFSENSRQIHLKFKHKP